jgi:excisionase family DNA binding protein
MTTGGPYAPDDDPILLPSEVAKMFRVDSKTVTRWAKSGKLRSIKTLGGHRRYLLSAVKEALAKASDEQAGR